MKLLTKTTDYDETIKLANKLTGEYKEYTFDNFFYGAFVITGIINGINQFKIIV